MVEEQDEKDDGTFNLNKSEIEESMLIEDDEVC